ncbi:MAG: 4-hydroxybenzoate octaprenyltransferase [Proteobacteria bacterium]|jgi:4-hydroxybenzoate polyprenyl transferase, proteobacterial|nr:MAG: 4-hydroxybenzoate octaprenyltransferase [Pseudomonadota bacterium]
MDATTNTSKIIADAPPDNWVDRHAPAAIRPYLKLGRFDRPIGAWLLLFPCWWSLALAELSRGRPYPNLWYVVLFFIGAFVMRGAGCTWNDIVDRNYDGQVARTALRPIPSGQVSVFQALLFGIGLSLVGLVVLLQFNTFTIWLGIASLGLVAIYPFFKRFTFWPQVVLGLTFKWGALVGWSAVYGELSAAPLVLYAGCVLWTIGYDTIYAHQDKEDDALLGLKSTALRFGDATQDWVGGFYAGAVVLWAIAGFLAGAHLIFFTALAVVAIALAWQVTTLDIDDPANCLRRFRSNRDVGWALFLGLIADMAISALAGLA